MYGPTVTWLRTTEKRALMPPLQHAARNGSSATGLLYAWCLLALSCQHVVFVCVLSMTHCCGVAGETCCVAASYLDRPLKYFNGAAYRRKSP